jgi:hypothetical protein
MHLRKLSKKLYRVVIMKRIVLTIAVMVVVIFSLILIPPIAMDLQLPAQVLDETSQTNYDEQSVANSNDKISTQENTVAVNVKSKSPAIDITVGNASGRKGSTVSIPINFKNVSKVGDVGTCNFYLKYDTKVLKAESITAGNIISNPSVNFSSSIDEKNGKISVLFLDDTVGNELIKKDGTFATITFKIIGSSGSSKISFSDGGAVGNGEMIKVDNVNRNDGVIKVK